MALSTLIEKFITVEQVQVVAPDLSVEQVEAGLEDVFAYLKTLCPGICEPDWTDTSVVSSVLRSAVVRRMSNSEGLETISYVQGENTETRRFMPANSSNYYLLLDERNMIIDACRAYKSAKGDESARRGGAEASRLTRYSGGESEYTFGGYVHYEPYPDVGYIRTHTALPLEEYR